MNAVSFKPVFQCDDSGKWYDNAQRFATKEEAYASAGARFSVWTMARAYDAHESSDPVNYRRDPVLHRDEYIGGDR